MHITSLCPLLVVALMLSGCEKPAAQAPNVPPPTATVPETPAPVVPDATQAGDFSLGQGWVKEMLRENDEKITKMSEDLERIRRELDRIDASPDRDSLGEVKQAMKESLSRQEADLLKLHSLAQEMRKVISADQSPAH